MAFLIADCARCGANQITFDVGAQVYRRQEYGWRNTYEIFCVCRSCRAPSIYGVAIKTDTNVGMRDTLQGSNDALVNYSHALNPYFDIQYLVSIRHKQNVEPPEHLPPEIQSAFTEAAACLSIDCFNAAGTMFRLCIDLATRGLLSEPDDEAKPQPPNTKVRRDLGLRLGWMFDSGILPNVSIGVQV